LPAINGEYSPWIPQIVMRSVVRFAASSKALIGVRSWVPSHFRFIAVEKQPCWEQDGDEASRTTQLPLKRMERFPPIQATSPSKFVRAEQFVLYSEGIEDLFFDGLTNPDQELILLQHVLDMNAAKLMSIFGNRMDRRSFQKFVKKTIGVDGDNADEIFSCATNLYDDDADNNGGQLKDCSMSGPQFAVAVVRIANLWSLMNEGMVDTSKLSSQTQTFLDSVDLA
jgi:hypothetical protein